MTALGGLAALVSGWDVIGKSAAGVTVVILLGGRRIGCDSPPLILEQRSIPACVVGVWLVWCVWPVASGRCLPNRDS